MELIRDIARYVLGARGMLVARYGIPAVVCLAVLVIAYTALGKRDGGTAPHADVAVRAQPMTPVELSAQPSARPQPIGAANTGSQASLSGSALIRALQTGLGEARCYDGPVNGLWTRKSKDATARFVAIVDAKLPVGQPDPVLLALLNSNATARCTDGDVAPTRAAQPVSASPASDSVPPPIRKPLVVEPAIEASAVPRPVATAPQASSSAVVSAVPAPSGETAERPFGLPLAGAAAGAATTAVIAAPAMSTGGPTAKAQDATQEGSAARSAVRETPRSASSRRYRHRKETAFDGVSRSMSRNFRSLQRSLNAFFD